MQVGDRTKLNDQQSQPNGDKNSQSSIQQNDTPMLSLLFFFHSVALWSNYTIKLGVARGTAINIEDINICRHFIRDFSQLQILGKHPVKTRPWLLQKAFSFLKLQLSCITLQLLIIIGAAINTFRKCIHEKLYLIHYNSAKKETFTNLNSFDT